MLKKVLMILMVSLLLTGCANVSGIVKQISDNKDSKKEFVSDHDNDDDDRNNNEDKRKKDEDEKDEDEKDNNEKDDNSKFSTYSQLIINCDLQNPEAQDDSYDVYIVVPDKLDFTPGKANQEFYYKIETDENNQAVLDVTENWDLEWYLSDAVENHDGMMEIWITTKEDIYIRNPLNQKTTVKFVVDDEDPLLYESTVSDINIPFVDAYPEGVLSLSFQDATFVIKLEFPEGYEPTSSFIVSVVVRDDAGMEWRNGRIDRASQYWDTPFFAEDGLANISGFIEIRDYDTDALVSYEGEPMNVTFDENGICSSGNIVVVKVIP